jgi:hypothetical protein
LDDGTRSGAAPIEQIKSSTPIRPTQTNIRERFFDQKLELARRHLAQIGPLLEALGRKLDAAAGEPKVEIDDSELDAIETLIWQYNDALESARKAWLDDDLSGDAYRRMTEMETPAAFNLPLFTDAQQAEWAKQQELQIGKRLGERIVTLDRIIVAMQMMETAGDVASVALGVGVVATAVRQGGKWAIVKTVAKVAASGAAAYGVGQGVEHGLRAAGASEETIHGVQYAAEMVTLLLLLRRVRSSGAKPVAPTQSVPRLAQPRPRPIAAKPSLDVESKPLQTPTAPRSTSTGLVPVAPVKLGEWGESRLSIVLGGRGFKPKSPYRTSLGKRYIDRLLDDVAHEAKAGIDVGLNSPTRAQALKDAELIAKTRIAGAHWHFFRGAKPELLEFLSSLGIDYTVH